MIDSLRTDFPPDMIRAAGFPEMSTVENMAADVVEQVKHYAREHPTAFGLWVFGIGFALGWKLKPW